MLDGRLFEHMKSTVYVFSDSGLCLGEKCPDHLDAARLWETDRIKHFVEGSVCRQLHDLAGDPVQFVRTTIQLLKYIQVTLAEEDVTLSSCQCTTT